MKIQRGYPTAPAVVVGSLVGIIALALTVFHGTGTMWAINGTALAALFAYTWSTGQLNLRWHTEINWAQGTLAGAITFVLVVGAQLIIWSGNPLIWGPPFAIAVQVLSALGLKRWGTYVVHEEEKV